MVGELAEVRDEPFDRHPDYDYRLISRRLLDVHNSAARDIPKLTRKWLYNPAFMNPADLADIGVIKGDIVEIQSDHASILGVVEPDDTLRPGLVSMPHGFGNVPGSKEDLAVKEHGSNTGRLTSVERDYDPYTGIPRMSTIPVNVRRADLTGTA